MLSLTLRTVLCAVFGLAACICTPAAANPAHAGWQLLQQRAAEALRELETMASSAEIDPAVPHVELVFGDLFEPLGERGLEYSEALRSLDGRTVRITGFIVREEQRTPGTFLLTSRPLRTDVSGGAGDLPPATLHVVLAPSHAERLVGYRPGAVTVVGVLELGVKAMRDGRNSVLRLHLDGTATQLALAGAFP